MDSIHATLLITVFAVISILGRGQEYQETAIPLTDENFQVEGGYVYKSFENVVEDTNYQPPDSLEKDHASQTTEASVEGEFFYPLEGTAETSTYQTTHDNIEGQELQETAIPLTDHSPEPTEASVEGEYFYPLEGTAEISTYKTTDDNIEGQEYQETVIPFTDHSPEATEASVEGDPLEGTAESSTYQTTDDNIEGHGYGIDEGNIADQNYQPVSDVFGENAVNPDVANEDHGFYPVEGVIEDHVNQEPDGAIQDYERLSEALDSLGFDYQEGVDPRQEFENELLKEGLVDGYDIHTQAGVVNYDGYAEIFSPLSDGVFMSEQLFVDDAAALFYQTFVPTTFPTVTEDDFEDERLVEYRNHVRRYLAELGEGGFDPQKRVTLSSGGTSKEQIKRTERTSSSNNEKKDSKDTNGLIRNFFNAVGDNSVRIMLHIIGIFDHLLHKES